VDPERLDDRAEGGRHRVEDSRPSPAEWVESGHGLSPRLGRGRRAAYGLDHEVGPVDLDHVAGAPGDLVLDRRRNLPTPDMDEPYRSGAGTSPEDPPITITLDPANPGYDYQSLLLAALGTDDPAEAMAQTPAVLRALVVEAGSDLRVRPAPGEWSVIEVIGHIVDAELVSSIRYRWIVAHDQPDLPGYDQAKWASQLRHAEADPAELLSAFDGLRALNLSLWRRLPIEDRARVGIHLERGPESYELTFALVAGHDRIHIAQAREALQQIRAAHA
jgi:hypothetical protein